eukprot:TRINITY_DN5401_c0_g1_i1.p1 TRINITY_DN5401_c0_g1~~TRINITY_DN5401_c0_g1_i1.p1  ORF type:complete len:453 (+),score=96.89 TRINITY_DN5401_c0_g1_i1:59-1360(+)
MDVRVYAMGCGHDHRLGVGRGEANKERPTAVSFFTENQLMVRDVYAGGAHSMVLTDKGLYAFGYNDEGQLGVGTFGICMKPTLIPLFKTEDIKGVSLGGYHSMVYTHSGGTFSFGANGNGQLGNGADDNAKNPTEIKLEGAVRDVSAGAQHTLAWTESGVYSWGLGDNGQLGYAGDAFDEMISKQNRIKAQIAHDAHINTMGGQRNATHYPDPDARVSEVGGYNPRHHPDAKKHDTRVFFAAFCQRTPKKIPFFETGEEVRSVHAGYNTSSVLTTNGIYVFGARPGVVREMLSDTVPTLVALPAEGMVFRQFLALKDLRVGLCEAADGTLSVWKSTEEELSWTPVIDDTPPDTRVHGTELSIYVSHSDGLSAFGDNFFGQLGYPTDVTQPDFTPPRAVDLPTLETTSPLFTPKVYKVAAGWHHALICVGFGSP